MGLKLKWNIIELKTNEEIRQLLINVKEKKYNMMSLDTETTGLHIILDTPFCVTFALRKANNKTGDAFIVDLRDKNEQFLADLQNIIKYTELLLLWNAKYDAGCSINA